MLFFTTSIYDLKSSYFIFHDTIEYVEDDVYVQNGDGKYER